ncbi:MAG: NAD-dependent epimerase/dehydratase family protein [Aggregatilineales bacterium]
MPVLITGGAGFIGSRLAMALRARGERIVLLDNFDSYYDPRLKRANVARFAADPCVTVIEGDVRDAALVDQIVAEHSIDRIAHLAGMPGVRASIDAGPLYVAVNVNGSTNVLEAARRHNVKLFVQASTSSVYGENTPVPFTEDASADLPLAPYPATKRAAELLGHAYHHLFGLNVTCLRFFNAYGPHGRPDMMPLKVLRAVRDGQPFALFNAGAFKRDWTYIDDIVAGVIAALEKPLGYRVINLGCGAPLAMTAFVEIIEQLVGRPAIGVDTPAPLSEPPITYCNNARARELLGFAPTVELPEGLARTWKWLQMLEPG